MVPPAARSGSIQPTVVQQSGPLLLTGTFNLQQGIRDNIYSPGISLKMWNLALIKTFRVYKANEFQFRAEAYDVFNYATLGGANYTPTSSQFGEVTSKNNTARNLQVGLRYQF